MILARELAPQRTQLPFWQQLRWQLISAFVFLAVLPASLVALVTISRTQEQGRHLVLNQLSSVAELKAQQIIRSLEENQERLRLIVDEPTSQQLVRLAIAQEIDPAAQDHVSSLLANLLDRYIDHSEDFTFESLFLYTPDGRVVAASDRSLLGRVVTRQPYFAKSLAKPYLQPPYYTVGRQELTMATTLPLKNAAGQTLGVLAGQVDLSTLGDLMLEHSGLGVSGETYLVSLENNYMVTPSRFDGYPMAQAYHSDGIDRALRGENGAGAYLDYRGVPVFGVYRWVPELQVALLAEINQSEAFESVLEARNVSLLLTGVAILVAVLYGLYTATRIAGPINGLAQVATRIASGDLNQRTLVRPRNEIGVLADVFNDMTEQLRQAHIGLEQRVSERTNELQAAMGELQARAEEQAQLLRAIEQQRALIRELSVPVIPVSGQILVMPLIGALDRDRVEEVRRQALLALERTPTRYLAIDITGVPLLDTQAAQGLLLVVQSVRLLGGEVILVGIRPEVAQALVGLGMDLQGIRTFVNLQAAVAYSSAAPAQAALAV